MKYFTSLPFKILRAFYWQSSGTMMRLTTSIILLTITSAPGQDLVGKYAAYYGHTLHLIKDSTFRYEWKFDLASSWSVGQWRVSKGIVYLNVKIDTKVFTSGLQSVMYQRL